MIRIDLGADDSKRSSKSKLGTDLFKNLGKWKFGGGKSPSIARGGMAKVRRAVGNLGAMAILIIAAVLAAVPHVVFLQYRLFVQNEHEARRNELQAKVSAIEKEIGKLKPYKKELESYEAQKTLVKDRLEVIRQLLSQRGTPVNVLDGIGQALPSRTWITSIDFDMKGGRPLLTLTGQSLTNEDISDYVDKLAESVHLQDVNLEGVTPVRAVANVEVKQFTLTIVPKGLKPLAKPVDPKGAVNTAKAAPAGKPPAGGAAKVTQ